MKQLVQVVLVLSLLVIMDRNVQVVVATCCPVALEMLDNVDDTSERLHNSVNVT